MSTPDIDALLGLDDAAEPAAEAKPARRGRRKSAPPLPVEHVPDTLDALDFSDLPDTPMGVRQAAIKLAGSGRAFIELGVLKRPVSKGFLAKLMGMDPETVAKRLVVCPELGRAGGNRPMYDFLEAIGYLLPPKGSLADYIESIDPNDLPNHINRAYWGALRERRKALIEMGDAWATEDVIQVFGEAFQAIKAWMQLLPDVMRERCGLSDKQYDEMTLAGDAHQAELHKILVEKAKQKRTRSLAADFDGSGEESSE